MKQNKRGIVLLLLSLLTLLGAGGLALGHALAARPNAAAYVNGEPVSLAEYRLAESRHRAGVIAYFQSAYGAEYGPEFWEQDFEEGTPAAVLRERALADCAQSKVMQLLARERGLVSDISFDALMDGMEAENQRRAADIAAGRVVYGAAAYTPETYYAYVNSNLALELKRSLEEDTLAWSDTDLRAWYDSHCERFRTMDEIAFQRISADFAGGDRNAALTRINRAAAELAAGRPFEAVAASFGGGAAERLGPATARDYSKYDEAVYNMALTLSPGETTVPFEADGAFVILRCIGRTAGALPDFSQIRSEAEVLFFNERFDNFLQTMTKEAIIEWVG